MLRRRLQLILLAASIIAPPAPAHAQAPAKPQAVLPPLFTVQPLEVGPPAKPKDEIELSPTPLDVAVEHPLLIEITVFQHEPPPENERHSTDPSENRIYTWSVRLATDGTLSGSGYSGSLSAGEFQGWGGAAPLSPDSLAKVKSLIAASPDDPGPPRSGAHADDRSRQVMYETSSGRIHNSPNRKGVDRQDPPRAR